jgi:hypothetical protein
MSTPDAAADTLVATPLQAAAIVAELDARIVDVAKAAAAGGAAPCRVEDHVPAVPGSPEPTD